MYKTLLLGPLAIGICATSLFGQTATPPPTPSQPTNPRPKAQGPVLDRNFTTFPQQTRQLAPPDVLARGKGLFGVNCTACHGSDLRGGDMGGPNLLRSLTALSDQHGELILPIIHGARQDKGMPAFNLSDADATAVAEYIHAVLASVGPKARPPGMKDISDADVLTGNATAGKTYFDSKCASCHSVTGDLKALATKYDDPRTLQNNWVAAGTTTGRELGAAVGTTGKPSTATVTMADGQKLEGTLIRKDDFVVTLLMSDGNRKSISLEGTSGVPKVEVHDPLEGHLRIAQTLGEKDMHDVTAYLATIK
jgi:cytochrome c oxidase cbb3-type subunit III